MGRLWRPRAAARNAAGRPGGGIRTRGSSLTAAIRDPEQGDQAWRPRAPAFATDDTRAEADAVLAGIGFGQLAAPLAQPHLRAGRLVEVLPEFRPEPWGLSVYRPQRGPVAARIRLVFDRLVEHFAAEAASWLRA